jgi:GNAT superfamily N-acetyltransferase
MDGIIPEAEWIERAALIDLHEAAGEELRSSLGLRLERHGGAVVSSAGAAPGIMHNRCIGLGFEEPATRQLVDRIVDHFQSIGVDRYYVHLVPDAKPLEIKEWLADRGLAPYRRSWMKFIRRIDPPAAPRTDLHIERIGHEWAETFGRIVAESFDEPARIGALMARLADRRDWHVYLSLDEKGDPAGTGAMFVRDRIAWFSYAATLPAYRGRGGQGAMLVRRIRDAIDLGARLMVAETGTALENEPQHSYRNIERAGFQRSYVRENWILPAGWPGITPVSTP